MFLGFIIPDVANEAPTAFLSVNLKAQGRSRGLFVAQKL